MWSYKKTYNILGIAILGNRRKNLRMEKDLRK